MEWTKWVLIREHRASRAIEFKDYYRYTRVYSRPSLSILSLLLILSPPFSEQGNFPVLAPPAKP